MDRHVHARADSLQIGDRIVFAGSPTLTVTGFATSGGDSPFLVSHKERNLAGDTQSKFPPAKILTVIRANPPAEPKAEFSGNKYHRTVYGLKAYGQQNESLKIDVYSFLTAFAVTIPGLQHAAKKIVCAGIRDKASRLQDLMEARDALTRAIEDVERETAEEAAKWSQTPKSPAMAG